MPAEKLALTNLLLILITEVIGTAVFAYGIVASGGQDSLVSISLFAGIMISYKFSNGHVILAI
jgi:aquaporin TIP/aquaporin related protein